MAAVNPPFVVQNGSHPADLFRRMVEAIVPDGDSVPEATSMLVEPSNPAAMNVRVREGSVFILGDSRPAQGQYYGFNDAPEILPINASNATDPRKDLVIARVYDDNEDGSGRNEWVMEVIPGVPGLNPAEPALPATAAKLAVVTVPAGAASIVEGNIKDVRNVVGPPYAPAASKTPGFIDSKRETSGDVKLGVTTWSDLFFNRLDLFLPAKAGDWIEAGMSFFASGQDTDIYFDAITIVGGFGRTSFATKGALPDNFGRGVSAWTGPRGVRTPCGGSVPLQLTANDIENGQVRLRIRRRNRDPVLKIIGATTHVPFEFWARNLG